jgi:putative NIF3 family GTP cyclohydrolase 1 type 2
VSRHPANAKNNKSWLIIHLNYDKRSLFISMWQSGCDRLHGSEAKALLENFSTSGISLVSLTARE